jgi:hypothetical protein
MGFFIRYEPSSIFRSKTESSCRQRNKPAPDRDEVNKRLSNDCPTLMNNNVRAADRTTKLQTESKSP